MEVDILFSNGTKQRFVNIEEIRILDRTLVLWQPDEDKHHFYPLVYIMHIEAEDAFYTGGEENANVWFDAKKASKDGIYGRATNT